MKLKALLNDPRILKITEDHFDLFLGLVKERKFALAWKALAMAVRAGYVLGVSEAKEKQRRTKTD